MLLMRPKAHTSGFSILKMNNVTFLHTSAMVRFEGEAKILP